MLKAARVQRDVPDRNRPASGAHASATVRSPTAGQVARVLETLDHLIELSGMSRREVAARLVERGGGTDLGRLLNGRLALKLSHVLDICREIDVNPLDLLRIAFGGAGTRSPLLQRLDDLIQASRASAAGRNLAAPLLEQLQRSLAETQRLLAALASAGVPLNPSPVTAHRSAEVPARQPRGVIGRPSDLRGNDERP